MESSGSVGPDRREGTAPVRGQGAGQLRGEAGGGEDHSFFTRSELSELKGQRSGRKGGQMMANSVCRPHPLACTALGTFGSLEPALHSSAQRTAVEARPYLSAGTSTVNCGEQRSGERQPRSQQDLRQNLTLGPGRDRTNPERKGPRETKWRASSRQCENTSMTL